MSLSLATAVSREQKQKMVYAELAEEQRIMAEESRAVAEAQKKAADEQRKMAEVAVKVAVAAKKEAMSQRRDAQRQKVSTAMAQAMADRHRFAVGGLK